MKNTKRTRRTGNNKLVADIFLLFVLVSSLILLKKYHVYADTILDSENNIKLVTDNLNLKYDDRYDYSSKYKDYVLVDKSNDVITQDFKSNSTLIAKNIGSSVIYLAHKNDKQVVMDNLNEIKSNSNVHIDGLKKDIYKINVKVEAAKLSVIFIAGQSNAEGSTVECKPCNSVVCEEGQVYSSYIPAVSRKFRNIIGITDNHDGVTINNINDYVADSLTSEYSIGNNNKSSKKLVYPLNSLTVKGKGKTGIDSGLAFEWNRKTGDKVWVVNAAVSGSKIETWQQNGDFYKRALKMYKTVLSVCNKEVNKGHYKLNKKMMFWLQGESNKEDKQKKFQYDYTKSVADTYAKNLKNVYKNFYNNKICDYFGVIMVRASFNGENTMSSDIHMTGPRRAQYGLNFNKAMSRYFVVSNINECWVTDAGVKKYFNQKYKNGYLTYPKRSNFTVKGLPSKVTDIHPDIHYTQIGHNENGFTAADGMYNVIYKNNAYNKAYFTNLYGHKVSKLTKKEGTKMVLVANSLVNSKPIIKVSNSCVGYNATDGCIHMKTSGTSKISIVDSSNNKTLATCNVLVTTNKAPKLKSIRVNDKGINLSFNKLSGINNYQVFRKDGKSKWKRIDYTSTNKYLDKNVTNGRVYSYTVRGVDNSKKYVLSNYDKKGMACCKLGKCPITNINSNTNGIKFRWKKANGAQGYKVYRKILNGKYKLIANKKANQLVENDNGVRNVLGSNITYMVRAYRSNYLGPYESKTVFRHGRVNIKKTYSNRKGQLTFGWSKMASSSGYQIQVSDSGFAKAITLYIYSGNVSEETVYNLTSNRKYSVRIRYYLDKDGHKQYGLWSNNASCITK